MLFPAPGVSYYASTIAALLLTALFFGMNSGPRDDITRAIRPNDVPERLIHGYTQKDFHDFQKLAATTFIEDVSVLELYRRRVLVIDIGFCLFCALASFLLWGLVERVALSAPLLSLVSSYGAAATAYSWVVPKVCALGAVLSILYGLVDASEDITLIYFLGKQAPTSAEVHFASFLTVTKILTIVGSGFGGALFKILSAIL